MSRTVSLVLIDPAGEPLGALPPFTVGTPWWQEVADVVASAGIDVTVLRLLHGDRPAPPGGHVTYLASTPQRPAGLLPVDVDLTSHPLRAAWAEAAGAEASVAWAAGALDRIGLSGAVARQQRTWNLSAIWRFDPPEAGPQAEPAGGPQREPVGGPQAEPQTGPAGGSQTGPVGGPQSGPAGAALREPVAWLKQVPPFFAHEAAVLRLVDAVSPGLVPYVLAAGEHGRMLLAHVPGEDRYGAGGALCSAVVAAVHPVQRHFAGRTGELRAAGVPESSLDGIEEIARPYMAGIPGLEKLIEDLPARLAAVDECGLPDTLVHGDLHPGNVRTIGTGPAGDAAPVIVDWGDSVIGNPAFDVLRLTDDPGVIREWAANWAGCDALRAVELLRPVTALRQAIVYANFLANIEPSEWPYHAADVEAALNEAAGMASR